MPEANRQARVYDNGRGRRELAPASCCCTTSGLGSCDDGPPHCRSEGSRTFVFPMRCVPVITHGGSNDVSPTEPLRRRHCGWLSGPSICRRTVTRKGWHQSQRTVPPQRYTIASLETSTSRSARVTSLLVLGPGSWLSLLFSYMYAVNHVRTCIFSRLSEN